MAETFIEKRVSLPEGFSASVEGKMVRVSGKGKQAEKLFKAEGISFEAKDGEVIIKGRPASRRINALTSTLASHVKNMAFGMESQYSYKLSIVYSHFPMNVAAKGNVFEINNFVGEKKTRTARILPNVTVTVKGKEVVVKSQDKEAAGQTAANIENATKVKGKDTRIYQDGIFIVEKAQQGKEKEGS
jgi:large subunit ribosomal protein L6